MENNIYDDILKGQAEQALHIASVTGQEHLIEKAFNELIKDRDLKNKKE